MSTGLIRLALNRYKALTLDTTATVRRYFEQKTNRLLFGNKRQQVTRNYSTQTEGQVESVAEVLKNKLADNQTQNILIASCKSTGSLRVNIMGLVGSLMMLAAGYNSWYIFASFEGRKRNRGLESSFLNSVLDIIQSPSFKIAICSVIILVGFGIFASTMMFTLRMVNKLYLLKGGQQIGIITDGFFGRNQTYRLNLNETSFKTTRRSKSTMIVFKNKKHFFYYSLNNVDSTFHEKALFDHYICKQRF